jgi:hypothetical protein
MMEGTAEVPHPIAAAHLPGAASVFDAATVLDPAIDRVDPWPMLVEFLVRHVLLPREGVLSTSNRKPPLRIPLRRVAKILTHPGQVEMVSPKRVDMLANERSDVAQRFVSNLMALGT